jgi:hypothetical protein
MILIILDCQDHQAISQAEMPCSSSIESNQRKKRLKMLNYDQKRAIKNFIQKKLISLVSFVFQDKDDDDDDDDDGAGGKLIQLGASSAIEV